MSLSYVMCSLQSLILRVPASRWLMNLRVGRACRDSGSTGPKFLMTHRADQCLPCIVVFREWNRSSERLKWCRATILWSRWPLWSKLSGVLMEKSMMVF